MNRTIQRGLIAAVLATAAVPALAQYSESYTFLKGVRDRDVAAVTPIITNPSSTAINARDGRTGEGGLHIVVRGRDASWLHLLLTRGARPDIQDSEGDTPLMEAARLGWTAGAEQLLVRRANPNLPNSRGETPLIAAVQRRDLMMVRLLLTYGADPNRTDSVAGYSALDYARRDNRAGAILRLLQAPRTPARPVAGPAR